MKTYKTPEPICLDFFCPKCNEGFRGYIWTTVQCKKCHIKLKTDFISNEFETTGTCQIIFNQ